MRTRPAVQAVGARRDDLVPIPIGSVSAYFGSLKVVGMKFNPDCCETIRIGDQLQFGPRSGSRHGRLQRITVSSMERWHKPIAEASGPEPVAIFTGFHVRRDTPVFLLTRPI